MFCHLQAFTLSDLCMCLRWSMYFQYDTGSASLLQEGMISAKLSHSRGHVDPMHC